jgi:hypothetical protein
MTYRPRDLRIVNNNTRDWDGGYTVEYGDVIVAGPYASKDDARQAKTDLIAGRPARSAG